MTYMCLLVDCTRCSEYFVQLFERWTWLVCMLACVRVCVTSQLSRAMLGDPEDDLCSPMPYRSFSEKISLVFLHAKQLQLWLYCNTHTVSYFRKGQVIDARRVEGRKRRIQLRFFPFTAPLKTQLIVLCCPALLYFLSPRLKLIALVLFII